MSNCAKAFVTALVVGAPSVAFGNPAESALGFTLRYDPPAGCPNRAAFAEAIASRVPGALATASGTIAFDVELASAGGSVSAVLVTTLPDGARSRRDVTAESCSEAVSALAVIAAVALNGYRESRIGGGPAPSSQAKPPGAVEVAEEPAPKPPAEKAAESPRAERVDTGAQRAPPGATRSSLYPGAFVAAAWESAVAPDAPFGGLAGVELAWARSGAWWPNLRAGVLATLAGSVTRAEGRATFRLLAARFGFCPVGWGDVGAPALRGCLELDAGKFDASGSVDGIEGEREQSMPWLAAGAAGRGEWPLGSWLSVEASAGLRALVRHDRFVFRPETVVYDVPPLSVGVTLGVVGRVP